MSDFSSSFVPESQKNTYFHQQPDFLFFFLQNFQGQGPIYNNIYTLIKHIETLNYTRQLNFLTSFHASFCISKSHFVAHICVVINTSHTTNIYKNNIFVFRPWWAGDVWPGGVQAVRQQPRLKQRQEEEEPKTVQRIWNVQVRFCIF